MIQYIKNNVAPFMVGVTAAFVFVIMLHVVTDLIMKITLIMTEK